MSTPKKKPFSVDIDNSPPPPPLTCMATTSISPSPQTNVAIFCNSPVASSSIVRSPVKAHFVDTNAMFVAINEKMDLLHEDFQKVVHSNVRMREELHSMRLEVNALRFTLAENPAKLSDDFPVQFPLNSVEDVQILNKQLEDRGLYLKLVTEVNGNERIFRRIMLSKLVGGQWAIAPGTLWIP
ncbi:hypothetical protein EG68_12111 [Paragonimus skrjabini miyazakii]|uniref:Uncharacterized protein n=1 Tax=Paragonimus skrjabini miyazakii TaxID=59628 RepID=A0A8S9YDF9_9TREM|nr:hypothetical protein EG68_12111 [Paragonimus skrjabini miyazakii]